MRNFAGIAAITMALATSGATLTGVQQMDLLGASRTVIIASEHGALNLRAVALP